MRYCAVERTVVCAINLRVEGCVGRRMARQQVKVVPIVILSAAA